MSSPTVTDAGLARHSASTGSITLHDAHDKASTLVQAKEKSSIRRWFDTVRQVVLPKNAQHQSQPTSNGKSSNESQVHIIPSPVSSDVVVAPCGASKEDLTDLEPTIKVEPAAVLRHVTRRQQASSVPASAFVSASTPTTVDSMVASESETVASTLLSDSIAPNDDKTMAAKPAKVKRSRNPSGPRMITPAMLEKIAKDNKKHQGALSTREAEVRKSGTGAASSTPRASGLQASPMRWSQD